MQRLKDQLRLTLQNCGLTRRQGNLITSVPEQKLRRCTSPALELINYHPINPEVGSYHKPDGKNRVSLWHGLWFDKTEVAVSLGLICVEALFMLKAEKITQMRVKASYISALEDMRLLFLFVLVMYWLHYVRALSGEYACVNRFGMECAFMKIR